MGSHYRGSPEQVRALSAFISLMRAAESLSHSRHQSLADSQLTTSQFGVLEALFHLGPMCQTDLGRKLLKSGGNVTMVINNLTRRELVERRRDDDDKRVITIHLTAAGRRLIRRVFPVHADSICSDIDVLTPREQETLQKLCRKLGRHVEVEHASPPSKGDPDVER